MIRNVSHVTWPSTIGCLDPGSFFHSDIRLDPELSFPIENLTMRREIRMSSMSRQICLDMFAQSTRSRLFARRVVLLVSYRDPQCGDNLLNSSHGNPFMRFQGHA